MGSQVSWFLKFHTSPGDHWPQETLAMHFFSRKYLKLGCRSFLFQIGSQGDIEIFLMPISCRFVDPQLLWCATLNCFGMRKDENVSPIAKTFSRTHKKWEISIPKTLTANWTQQMTLENHRGNMGAVRIPLLADALTVLRVGCWSFVERSQSLWIPHRTEAWHFPSRHLDNWHFLKLLRNVKRDNAKGLSKTKIVPICSVPSILLVSVCACFILRNNHQPNQAKC